MKKPKPKPRHFISAQTISRGADLRKAGFSWNECADMLGEKMQSLRAALDRNGVPAYGKRGGVKIVPDEAVLKARELRAQGMPWKRIEKQLGFNWLTIVGRIMVENREARKNAQRPITTSSRTQVSRSPAGNSQECGDNARRARDPDL